MHSLMVCCDSTFHLFPVYIITSKKELVYILIGYKPVLFLSIYIIFTIHINHSIFPTAYTYFFIICAYSTYILSHINCIHSIYRLSCYTSLRQESKSPVCAIMHGQYQFFFSALPTAYLQVCLKTRQNPKSRPAPVISYQRHFL